MHLLSPIIAKVKIVIPTRSEGSLKIKFGKNVVRSAKVLTSHCFTSTGLGHRDPSLRIGMTIFTLAFIDDIERIERTNFRVA